MAKKSASEKYVEQAENRLKSLVENIERFQDKRQGGQIDQVDANDHSPESKDLSLQERLEELREQLENLRSASEERWSDLQTQAELGFWNMKAFAQRVSETAGPLIAGNTIDSKAFYFLQPHKGKGWALIKQGAKTPAKLFESKAEGLEFSRHYVRGKSPSQLVVRKKDGTFQVVHRYR